MECASCEEKKRQEEILHRLEVAKLNKDSEVRKKIKLMKMHDKLGRSILKSRWNTVKELLNSIRTEISVYLSSSYE